MSPARSAASARRCRSSRADRRHVARSPAAPTPTPTSGGSATPCGKTRCSKATCASRPTSRPTRSSSWRRAATTSRCASSSRSSTSAAPPGLRRGDDPRGLDRQDAQLGVGVARRQQRQRRGQLALRRLGAVLERQLAQLLARRRCRVSPRVCRRPADPRRRYACLACRRALRCRASACSSRRCRTTATSTSSRCRTSSRPITRRRRSRSVRTCRFPARSAAFRRRPGAATARAAATFGLRHVGAAPGRRAQARDHAARLGLPTSCASRSTTSSPTSPTRTSTASDRRRRSARSSRSSPFTISRSIVLGGLIKDSVSETVNKIPLLGDIPILGLPLQDARPKTIYEAEPADHLDAVHHQGAGGLAPRSSSARCVSGASSWSASRRSTTSTTTKRRSTTAASAVSSRRSTAPRIEAEDEASDHARGRGDDGPRLQRRRRDRAGQRTATGAAAGRATADDRRSRRSTARQSPVKRNTRRHAEGWHGVRRRSDDYRSALDR